MKATRSACGMVAALLVVALSVQASERSRQDRACQSCHKEIAAQWRDSFHRRSYSDPDYAAALAQEPRPFCRGCHAPESDARKPATGWAAASGVACVSCHLRDGVVISGPGSRRRAPHAVTRRADFAEAVCQPCHEFEFPDAHLRERPELMQSTVSEHRQSETMLSCVDCHMRRSHGVRSHLFPGGHDPALLRGAVTADAQLAGDVVRVSLRPLRIGHALPTGDLFRRLLVEVISVGANGPQVVAAQVLQRHFGMEQQRPGAWVKITEFDDRIVGPTTVELQIPAAANPQKLRWQVRYQRVGHPLASAIDAVVDGEVLLASGEL